MLNQTSELDPLQRLLGIRVLLVEDELDISDLLVFILKSAGAEILLFTDAENAFASLESLHPDILLCDIKLPLHNGDWLIQQIRSHSQLTLRQLPAIALTSYSRDFSEHKILAAGFDRFLVKFEHSIVDEVFQLLST